MNAFRKSKMGQTYQRGMSDQILHRLINCHEMTSLYCACHEPTIRVNRQIIDMFVSFGNRISISGDACLFPDLPLLMLSSRLRFHLKGIVKDVVGDHEHCHGGHHHDGFIVEYSPKPGK